MDQSSFQRLICSMTPDQLAMLGFQRITTPPPAELASQNVQVQASQLQSAPSQPVQAQAMQTVEQEDEDLNKKDEKEGRIPRSGNRPLWKKVTSCSLWWLYLLNAHRRILRYFAKSFSFFFLSTYLKHL